MNRDLEVNPLLAQQPGVTTLLVLAAATTDAIAGCGGALIRHVEAGSTVHLILIADATASIGRVPRHGERELRAARKVVAGLGLAKLECWRIASDGNIYGERLITRLCSTLIKRNIQLLYAPSVQEQDPVRRQLAMVAVEATRRQQVGRLAMYEIDTAITRPNIFIDTSQFVVRQREALDQLRSGADTKQLNVNIDALHRFRSQHVSSTATHAEALLLISAAELERELLDLYASEHQTQKRLGISFDARDWPLVSVLIRSVDRATLTEALDSVALQTYPNIEVVVANARGAGHRALPEWCGRYPLRFLDSESPVPRAKAANRLLQAARGELLQFLDDDDWLDPNHIIALQRSLMPGDVAAYSAVQCVDAKRQKLEQQYAHEWDPILLRAGNYVPMHAVLFSQSTVEKGCRFDESLEVLEDWDFWLQLSRLGRFRYVDQLTAMYRIHEGGGWGVNFQPMESMRATAHVLRKWGAVWTDKELLAFSDKMKVLDAETRETKRSLCTMQGEVAITRGELATTRGELATTRKTLYDSQNAWKASQEESAKHWQLFQLETNKVLTLTSELARASANLDVLKNQMEATQRQVAAVEEARQAMEREALRRGKWALELQSNLQRREGELKAAEDQCAALSHDAEVANAQLALMYASTSWRITAPIRGLRKLIRGGRGIVGRRLRSRWHSLPISMRRRIIAKRLIFTTFRPLLGRTQSWKNWDELDQQCRRLRSTPLDFTCTDPSVSVVVPDDIPELLLPTLSALRHCDPDLPIDLVVVQRGTRWLEDYLDNSVTGVRRLRLPRTRDLREVWQAGAAAATADSILFLPAGFQPGQGCLRELLCTLEAEDVAAAVPKLVDVDGTLTEAGWCWNDEDRLQPRGHGEHADHPAFGYRVEVVTGSVIAVKRRCISQDNRPMTLDGQRPVLELGRGLAQIPGNRVVYQPMAALHAAQPHLINDATDDHSREPIFRPADSAAPPARAPLLILDLVTPTPDQDSGSVDAYHQLKILVELGYQPCFLPVSTLESGGRYTDDLRRLGVECWHRPWIESVEEHLRINGDRYRYVMLSRQPTAARYMDLVLRACSRARIIFNTVDLHHLREQRQADLTDSDEQRATALAIRESELAAMRKAHVTILISYAEQELIARELPTARTRVVPLIMDISDRHQMPGHERKNLLFIGGFRHLPNVDAAHWLVRSIWPLVSPNLPGARCLIVGSHPPAEVLALAADTVEVTGFKPDVSGYFNGCRLSVAPLRFGAGLKGKVGRSLGYGLPVVATSIAVEGSGLKDGQEVLIRDSEQAFADAIISLYHDDNLWTHLSKNALAFFEANYSHAAGRQALSALLDDIVGKGGLQSQSVESGDSYRAHQQQMSAEYARRSAVESGLASAGEVFTVRGYCAVCRQDADLHCDYLYALMDTDGNRTINWRERLVCPGCQLNNRMRAAIHLFERLCQPTPDDTVYLTEQTTPLYDWFASHFDHIIGSEYLGDHLPRGEADPKGIRNEDITKLTFDDQTIDHILSFDVLEHVPDYKAALREFWRVLKPGGSLLFSVPFASGQDAHVVRARIAPTGEIEHLMEPEYHGDPLSQSGCLCYYHFGWDLLNELRDADFQDVAAELFWSREFGYLGMEQMLLHAHKPVKTSR